MPLYRGSRRLILTRRIPAVVAGVSTAFDPTHKSANITLSGSNLIATLNATTGGFDSVLATVGKSSGKYYAEFTPFFTVNNPIIGISNLAGFISNDFIGDTAGNLGWDADNRILSASAVVTNIQTFASGDTACMAADLTNSKIWFRTNGGNWNNDVIGNQNPATNTGGISLSGLTAGPYFPGVSILNLTGNSFTANFGNTAYAQAVPSGFGNWV